MEPLGLSPIFGFYRVFRACSFSVFHFRFSPKLFSPVAFYFTAFAEKCQNVGKMRRFARFPSWQQSSSQIFSKRFVSDLIVLLNQHNIFYRLFYNVILSLSKDPTEVFLVTISQKQ